MQGIVSKINCRDKGTFKLYSFALKGQDGWHSMGFNPPSFVEGQSLEFEVRKNARGYDEVDTATVRVLADSEPVQVATASQVAQAVGQSSYPKKSWSGGSGFKGNTKKDEYWDARELRDVAVQKRIEIQSCRNSALQLVEILLENEAVKLPAKEAAKESVVTAMVKKYTEDFLAANNGDQAPQSVVDTKAEAPSVPGGEPDESWEVA